MANPKVDLEKIKNMFEEELITFGKKVSFSDIDSKIKVDFYDAIAKRQKELKFIRENHGSAVVTSSVKDAEIN